MALPNITFLQSASGLGRPLDGQDHVSGLAHYNSGTLPTGFSSSDRIKKVFSVSDAETLGITNTGLGETKSTATFLVTNKGAAGDTMKLTVSSIDGLLVLANYTQVTADVVSVTTAGDRLALEINTGTNTHGFTAVNVTGTVTITAKAGEGIFLNTGTPYVTTIVGTLAGTLTQNVVAGVAGYIDTLHYHISEYFRMQPKGELYVGIFAVETTYAFADITAMINFSNGEIRQVGVYFTNTAFTSSQTTALQGVVTAATAVYKPFQAVLSAEISGTVSVATLTNLSTLSNPNVSVVIAQDGAAKGYHLYKAVGKSIGVIGATLGAISLAKVSESIAWVQKFNVSNTELETLAFANGQVYNAIADSQLESLNTYNYTFLRKLIGISGSYFSDSKTVVTPTSDYATIENNRVYHKITREVRAALLPTLSSPLKVNSNGTLSQSTISYFESLANRPLTAMESNGEISAHKVIINPNQDVLATSTLELTLQNVPLGVARIIKVNVGFVKSV